MSTLVLGGSGFIGSKLTEQLSKRGYQPLSYDLIQSNLIPNSAKWVKADILDPLSLERLFFEYEIKSVVHFIGLPDIAHCEKDPQLSFYLNVLSLQNALEAMRKADVQDIVFASSAAVYGYSSGIPIGETSKLAPNTIYGHHKLIGEQLVESYSESYGLRFRILRLFNVYGAAPPTGKDVISIFIKRALNNQPIVVRGPKKFRDFIHVNEVVDVVCKLMPLNRSNSVFNVGTGTKIRLEQIADVVARYFKDVEVVKEDVPDNGTGIVADLTKLSSTIDLGFGDTLTSIENHIASYSSPKSR